MSSLNFTDAELENLKVLAASKGFSSTEDFVRSLADIKVRDLPTSRSDLAPTHTAMLKTTYGKAILSDSFRYISSHISDSSVDLIMTSPPFGLVRKKAYGNEDADRYCEWFEPFAEQFMRVLKPTGSLVIDIGGAWKRGSPTRSLYHFKLLVMLVERYGFHLAQEHYWWNPSKLPTPAEWVNIRRIRVKDAVNSVYWLSKTEFPKANNRRVLQPYSKSMKSLLQNGYKAKLRPSGHNISDKFSKDNGGSVPPNLLAVANTESNSQYQKYCRENGLPIHPARYPSQLPEYFVRMLTDENDVVVDPFAGSCVTGEVCERLKRFWVCIDTCEDYLLGAEGRFESKDSLTQSKQSLYAIASPIHPSVTDDALETRLDPSGGRERA